MEKTAHVVIIGGGFGGLTAARALAEAPVQVTLIDRRNHHLFQPLLYQVATAALNPGDIAYPIRAALSRQQNARVLLAEARAIDAEGHRVLLDSGSLSYDYLIIATGATHSYFGQPWASVAPGLKSIEDALEIRRRVFLAYEAAEREADPAKQREWLTFVVVGGGPTGVELAGALRELGVQTLAHDFRRIDPTSVRVILIEGEQRVLHTFAPRLSEAALRTLTARRVEVRLSARVVAIDEGGVTARNAGGDTERIGTHTVLWAAGVQASPLAKTLGAPLDRSGRVEVQADLTIPGHEDLFVVGDLAKMVTDGQQVPGVAQGAIQSARYAARAIAAHVQARRRGQPPPARAPFRYEDKGSMAAIGRSQAVVQLKHVERAGFFAWLLWWVVHIVLLIGFRNRFSVMWQWIWSYLTFQRGARLITGPVGALPEITAAEGARPALPPEAASTLPPAEKAAAPATEDHAR